MKDDVLRKGKPRPKPKPEPKQPDFEIDHELRREMLAEAGAGLENVTIADRASWLPDIDDPDSYRWYVAFENIDARGGDKRALLALLDEGKQPPPAVLPHLRDLIARYVWKHPPGKRRTPSYDRTGKEITLAWALRDAREAVRAGVNVQKAIDKAAKKYRIKSQTLALAYQGKLGSMRKVNKRQRGPKK